MPLVISGRSDAQLNDKLSQIAILDFTLMALRQRSNE
jgi:hypothetical protein